MDHVRLDKDEGWLAVADFLVAMTRRYGLDERIASLTIGEYWANPKVVASRQTSTTTYFAPTPKRCGRMLHRMLLRTLREHA